MRGRGRKCWRYEMQDRREAMRRSRRGGEERPGEVLYVMEEGAICRPPDRDP